MKKLSITLVILQTLAFSNVKSLNIFEFSLIGVGAGLIYDQYFDSSLNSDNIYVVDSGRIIAEGNHEELMNSSSIYKNFYDKQIKM